MREKLVAHYTELRYWNVEQAATWSLSIEGASSRIRFLCPLLPPALLSPSTRVLVSGMGSGSEMLAARSHGFLEVHGTEIEPFAVELCRQRFGGLEGLHPRLVSGRDVPYPDASFELVVSGHIVEHTEDPALYVKEHLRVLAPGGFLFLEFPTRFHHTELHTGLPSVEWLPTPVRNAILRTLRSPRFPSSQAVKGKCQAILGTALKQVSVGAVRRWVAASGYPSTVVRSGRVSPGVVFGLVQRG